jgi:hypothetical protein
MLVRWSVRLALGAISRCVPKVPIRNATTAGGLVSAASSFCDKLGFTVREIDLQGLHDAAQVRADQVPELNRSMRGSKGNEVGAMGELIVMRYLDSLNVPYVDVGVVNHDLATPFGTIDVKTKERTVVPQPHYDCTVPNYVKGHQAPDTYMFVSLFSDKSEGCWRFKRGWVLGSISRLRFEQVAVLWEPDRTDDSNGWSATIACWNVPVSQLKPPLGEIL